MKHRRIDGETFIEHNAPWAFVVIGVAMIVIAAFDYLAGGPAIAFAVLGAVLVVIGGTLPVLEGALEFGRGGLKSQIKQRKAELIMAAEEVAPERVEPLKALADYLDPTTPVYWGVKSPEYRHKLDRELARVWLADTWPASTAEQRADRAAEAPRAERPRATARTRITPDP
jgi:hypothetical protein